MLARQAAAHSRPQPLFLASTVPLRSASARLASAAARAAALPFLRSLVRADEGRLVRLAWLRLQEPLKQKRRPRLFPDDSIDCEVLIPLIVLDRFFGG
jgi:hypothetical protein